MPTPVPLTSSASILALTHDPEARDLLLELALAEGFGVRCAETEVEAAEILRLEPPGLVLVDLDLPSRLGAKFMRDLRQGPLRALPRMAITASNDPMLAVTVDAPVFFKPGLDGIDAAIEHLFRPR
ncbi:MAG TPA: response regulator [Polyangia bacterium]|nr:response regulator [Polyangia bacterium]